MDSKTIIARLGGPSEVARMCECKPQAVTQWYGIGPDGQERTIPKARLLHLKAIHPEVFEEEKPKRRKTTGQVAMKSGADFDPNQSIDNSSKG